MPEEPLEVDEAIADRVARFHARLLSNPLYAKQENKNLVDALVLRFLETLLMQSALQPSRMGHLQ